MERRTVFTAAAGVSATGLLAACSGGGSGQPGQPEAVPPPKAKIAVEPAPGARDVEVLAPITIRALEGKLTEARVVGPDGKQLAGELSPDRASWSSKEPLGYGKDYRYEAKAVGTDNRPVELGGAFTTVQPRKQVRATLTPGEGAEVGVAMPVSVKFEGKVADKAAVQRALHIETTPQVEGEWAWLSPTQVDWRPKEYWPARTQVRVSAKLYGIPYGDGSYGKSDVDIHFKVGRNQVVKINTPDHQMRVYRDGAQAASYPCSNGKDADPNLNTPNGTMVIMTKEPTAIFDNARYGYTNIKKTFACRFSNHGEFIHENDENAANIGKDNTSHGCVNLSGKDAKAFFSSAMIGDPVEVTGSKASMPKTSDIMDWLIDWETWRSKSALK